MMEFPYFTSLVISVSLNLALSLLNSKYTLLKGMEKDIILLSSLLNIIRFMVEDAEKQLDDPHIRDWLGRVAQAVCDAEDILKSLETEACLWQQKHKATYSYRTHTSEIQIAYQHPEGSTELKDVLARLDGMAIEYVFDLTMNAIVRRETYGAEHTEVLGKEDAPFLPGTEVLGREDDREKIIQILLSPELDTEDDIPVLPVVGMGGLGKTVLAGLVYKDDRVEENFDLRMWVWVGMTYDYQRILQEMIEQSSKIYIDIPTLSRSQLETHLLDLISGRKFFLVLDDVSLESQNTWKVLQDLLKQGAKGSRVMITTQSTKVSTVSSSSKPYCLDFLPEDKCWLVFKKSAFKEHIYIDENLHTELEIIGRKIVSKCEGLPLAIKVLGHTLHGETNVQKWQRVLEKFDESMVFQPLKLSYDHLPLHLKRCFSYCSLFPKSHVFDKNEIVKLWLAQSFIQPDPGTDDALDVIGIRYFDELSSKSFFLTIHGNNTRYKIHNLFHDLAKYVSSPQCYQINGQESYYRISQSSRHVSLVCYDVEEAALKLSGKATKLRTLITLKNAYHGVFRVESLDKIFHAFKYLRTLDLSSSLLTELPSSVEELKLLHQLDLSRTKIRKLPDSICNLYNLLTLKLLECRLLLALPQDLLKLVNLKNLELDDDFWVKLYSLPLRLEYLLNLQNFRIHNHSKRRYIPKVFNYVSEGPDSIDRPSYLISRDQELFSLMSNFVRLTKRKDLWHFFKSSYPMDHMPDLYNFYDLQIYARLNCLMTTCNTPFHDKNYQVSQEYMTLLTISCRHLETTANLNAFPREIRPYLPKGWTLENDQLYFNAPSHQATSFNVIPDWAIKSAIIQATHFFTNGLGRLLAISGQDAEKVADKLAFEPDVLNKFDIVLYFSLSQFCSNKEVREGINRKINEFLGAHMSYEESLKSLNFLLILVCIDESYFDLYKLKIPLDHGLIVLTTQSADIYRKVAVDVEIKMEYHLLPWELFCKNINKFCHISSPFNDVAVCLVQQCLCNLLAIILLARALKDAEVDVWEEACNEIMLTGSPSTEEAATEVLIRVLKFIWSQKNKITRRCIQHYVEYGNERETNRGFVVLCWLLDGLVRTAEEGGEVVEDLISSFLIDDSQDGSLQMHAKIKTLLSNCILAHYGSERMGTTIIEAEAKSINIQNGELNELPRSPGFTHLKKLIMNGSSLMKIAPSFFESMPVLQVLDLSHTSIMILPSTILNLVSLKNLTLRCCELLMELPPEIGELQLLKVLDARGTEIMHIPKEIENLKSLEELQLSLYGQGERFRKKKGTSRIYPGGVLSKLLNLKILRIDANPDEEQWINEVEYIISDLKRINLRNLELYLPKVELLGLLTPPNFKLVVGRYEVRMISRIPHEVNEKFKTLDKSLKYINGDTISTQLVAALNYTRAFFLDRHWTIRKLSEMGTANLVNLEFGFLVECNELEAILDEDEFHKENDKQDLQFNERLGSLEYLGLYYLRNLTSICRGQVGMGTLSKLKHLSLRTCISLTHVFTFELIKNLENLEEILLEDCPKIKSLVTDESSSTIPGPYLPRLKKLSLLGLPEMVSIGNGLCIAPELEKLVVFYCPKLENISTKELSCKHLKVLKGESEWWESLEWDEWDNDDQDNLAELFVPIKWDRNLNAQLTRDGL